MRMDTALRALRGAGYEVVVRDSRHVEVNGRWYRHYNLRKSATRRDAERALAASGDALFTPDSLTPSLRALALSNKHVVVVTDSEIVVDQQVISLDDPTETPPARRSGKGRKPYARFAIARVLLVSRSQSLSQLQIAELARVTQSAVTKALATPLFKDVVVRGRGAIAVTDREELVDRVISGYPGPGGIVTYWWKESSPMAQGNDILAADPAALRSGDVAADLLRARRKPEHAVVYAQSPVDPRQLGFATADPNDYTLMLAHAEDPTIPATAEAWYQRGVVDPLIAAYDVLRTGTTGDQDESVEALRQYAIEGVVS